MESSYVLSSGEHAEKRSWWRVFGRYSDFVLQRWKLVTLLLCTYGFFKELKPSEAFLNPYLLSRTGLSNKQLSASVYPFWTYSYLFFLFIFLPLTDFSRYKPMILLESIGYLGTRVLLIWCTSLQAMQLMQVFYGLATATEVAYYSYIYAVVAREHYPFVNSAVRAVVLIGRSSAGYLGQILDNTDTLDYRQLNYFSFVTVCIALGISIFLPMPPRNYSPARAGVNREESSDFEASDSRSACCCSLPSCREVVSSIRVFLTDIRDIFRDREVLRWSLWWALATCGELQAGNYVQNLWANISDEVYYGYVEATATLLGAGAAFLVGYVSLTWSIWGEMLLGVVSTVDSFALFFMAHTSNIYWAYGLWLIFRATYSLQITVATLQVAQRLRKQRYGLVFGINMWMALVLQTILTAVCTAHYSPLRLGITTQFVVYGCYFWVIGAVFLASGVYSRTKEGWRASWRRDRATRRLSADLGAGLYEPLAQNCDDALLINPSSSPTPSMDGEPINLHPNT